MKTEAVPQSGSICSDVADNSFQLIVFNRFKAKYNITSKVGAITFVHQLFLDAPMSKLVSQIRL